MKIRLVSICSLIISLVTLMKVGAICDSTNPALCPPPPFPDFISIFRETLKVIPELKLSSPNVTSTEARCPTVVNWIEFNARLENGKPVPLNPVCSLSTTANLPTTHYVTLSTSKKLSSPSSSSSSSSSSSPSSSSLPLSSTSSSRSSEVVAASTTTQPCTSAEGICSSAVPEVVLPKAEGQTGNEKVIGLAVGITVGVPVTITVVVVIVVIIMCRRGKKIELLQRGVSTTSQAPLANDYSSTPTTPSSTFTQDPMSANVIQNGIITLRDSTFQESSTDATLPRKTDPELKDRLAEFVMNAELKKAGLENKGFEVEEEEEEEQGEEEQDDAGYEGSEVGQELWENEMNVLFDQAKLESSEDVSDVVYPATSGGGHQLENRPGSIKCNEATSQFIVPTVNDRSRDLFRQPSAANFPALRLNLPPPSIQLRPQFNETTPTTAQSSPFSTPSSTKPLIAPRSNGSRHPLSQALESNRASKRTKAKVRFEPESIDSPPAYSSPVSTLKIGDLFNGNNNRDVLIEFPEDASNGLPTYNQAVASLQNYESDSNATSHSNASFVNEEKRPTPKPKPRSQSSIESRMSSVSSDNGRSTNTAVIRPWTPGNSSTASDANVETIQEATNGVRSSNSGNELLSPSTDHSFRPVRSLRSQFEAAASSNKTDSKSNNTNSKA